MDIDADKVDKMKVAELRAMLSSHDLDTKGTKPVLVARLKEFLSSEGGSAKADGDAPKADGDAPEVVEEVEEVEEGKEDAKEEAMEVAEAEKASPAKPAAEAAKTEETPKTETEEKKEPATPNAESKRGQKRKREDEPFVVTEDEPEIPENFVCLDWSNSDLTCKINKETFLSAEPFHLGSWAFIFSSARATHGFTSGKIAFEVKWTGNMEVKLEDVKEPHELRVGFSTDDSNLQAGESELSYAVSNFGKKATDTTFEDFEGCTFTADDVITAYLDLSGSKASISFAKNGEMIGEAFNFPKSKLGGKALFPHISSRNVKFEVNFGKNKDETEKEKFFALQDGYKMAAECVDEAQRGFARIAKREECEIFLLIGLPGSGKSFWATKQVEDNPDKRYNVIGTSKLVERMKVNGEPRKKHVGDKWDALFSKLTKCAQDMIRIASQRRRNFIIDQTNVFANAQKRKVRNFEGMTRQAVVIVPSDEDYKGRVESQEKAESKEVPDNAVMEMKANFALPEEGEESPFKEIIFTELKREEAAKVVEEYNKDAKEKGFGKKPENQNKKRRGNNNRNNRGRGQNMQRGRGNMRGNMRGMRGMPFGRGGFPPRGMMRGGPMRGGPMRGGPMRGGPMGPPRGMPFGGMRGGMQNRGMHNRGGMPNRGGPGNRGGPQNFGGGPAPWNKPNPWQQQQQRPQAAGWGNMWNQGGGGGNQGGHMGGGNNAWGGQNRQGGGQMNNYGGGQNNYGGQGGGNFGFSNNQGYPGSQNWGGFR